MTQLVEYLAELTGFRDRDVIDVTLASAFRALLRPQSVGIYRPVGEADDRRWMTRTWQAMDQIAPSADPLWTSIDTLPPLMQHPARCEALAGRTVTASHSGHQLTLYPLTTDHTVVGVLELETLEPLEPQAHETIRGVLRLYRNFQNLLDYSEHDTLTGLLNRKSFDESFSKIAAGPRPTESGRGAERRSHDSGEHYWLAMIDIDFFKSVNDRFGHMIGDEVLLLLARLMGNSFRSQDRLYRFGGEEFLVVLPCRSSLDAARVFERFRSTTEQHVFPQVSHITVSIGYTQIKTGDSAIAALGRADKAIYYAKEHGRNQVHSYSDLVASGALKITENVGTVELF